MKKMILMSLFLCMQIATFSASGQIPPPPTGPADPADFADVIPPPPKESVDPGDGIPSRPRLSNPDTAPDSKKDSLNCSSPKNGFEVDRCAVVDLQKTQWKLKEISNKIDARINKAEHYELRYILANKKITQAKAKELHKKLNELQIAAQVNKEVGEYKISEASEVFENQAGLEFIKCLNEQTLIRIEEVKKEDATVAQKIAEILTFN
ncbi:MAG: hypothetical protein ACOYOK_00005 [Pseudobdellovibrionaceae bacterium]